MTERWKLIGHDTFSDEEYSLGGEYPDEEAALDAAHKKLLELEECQPSPFSGGQAEDGIQDRIFIQRPDGTKYRFIPSELKDEL